MDEVRDGLDHAVLLVVCNLSHEAEVENHEAAIRSAQHVAWVRVGVEEARVQELREVSDHPQVHESAHVVRSGLAQLLTLHPLGHVHAPRRVLGVVLGDYHLGQHSHLFAHALAVLALHHVIQFLVEATSKLIHEIDNVQALRQRGDFAKDQARLAHEVEVQGHGLQDERALHLDRHFVPRVAQRGLVHLPERCSSHGLRCDRRENL
mmetsp:Transcript_3961/g.11200  ORF Transcript_3961/g.11200 Transcript_3961/m.11200 type:complete len:207 (+) Transcript_3961:1325-1945(+)